MPPEREFYKKFRTSFCASLFLNGAFFSRQGPAVTLVFVNDVASRARPRNLVVWILECDG